MALCFDDSRGDSDRACSAPGACKKRGSAGVAILFALSRFSLVRFVAGRFFAMFLASASPLDDSHVPNHFRRADSLRALGSSNRRVAMVADALLSRARRRSPKPAQRSRVAVR